MIFMISLSWPSRRWVCNDRVTLKYIIHCGGSVRPLLLRFAEYASALWRASVRYWVAGGWAGETLPASSSRMEGCRNTNGKAMAGYTRGSRAVEKSSANPYPSSRTSFLLSSHFLPAYPIAKIIVLGISFPAKRDEPSNVHFLSHKTFFERQSIKM